MGLRRGQNCEGVVADHMGGGGMTFSVMQGLASYEHAPSPRISGAVGDKYGAALAASIFSHTPWL